MLTINKQLTNVILVNRFNIKWEVHLHEIDFMLGLTITLFTMKYIYELLVTQLISVAFSFYLVDDVVESIYLN